MSQEAEPINNVRDNRWRIAGWSIAGAILLLPLIAMQFTTEVAWDILDFVIAATLLGGTGLLLELTVRKTTNLAYKTAMGIAIFGTLVLIWINGAVGIIGNENNPLNLMFAGVIAVGLAGALIAKFKARGMARAMVAVAIAQAVVAVIAFAAGYFTLVLSVFFIALWLVSARLFQNGAESEGV